MENNQSTQQHSSELGSSKLSQSSRRKTLISDNSTSVLTLIKRWPWLIWGGVWALLLAITAIAIFSLTHPIGVEQEEPESKPVAAEKPTKTPLQIGSPMPLWLVGAAALTFAAGSLVIFKRLNSSVESPKLRNRSSKRGLTRRQQRKQLLQEDTSNSTQSAALLPAISVLAEIEPVVVEMPLEESRPLDLSEQSLAVPDDGLSFSSESGSGDNRLDSQTEAVATVLPLAESHSLNSDEKILAVPDNRPSFSAAENLTPGNNLDAETEPVVTVLPPEENRLNASSEESLAEMMDIRKHRSLSSILRDS